MKLAGKRFSPVTIFANFKVENEYLILPGFPAKKIRNNKVVVEYCFGECIMSEGYFTISAMYISKFYNQQINFVTTPMCNAFDKKHWDCVDALCHYDVEKGKCTSPTLGMIFVHNKQTNFKKVI